MIKLKKEEEEEKNGMEGGEGKSMRRGEGSRGSGDEKERNGN